MVDVVTRITINRPWRQVAGFARNPDHAPDWYANIRSVRWRTKPPLRVGTRVDFVAQFLGRRLSYTYEFVELSPQVLVMRTSQGPFPMETTYRWTPIGKRRTRMELRNRGRPKGFSWVLGPFIAVAMRRTNNKDLSKLKRILEEDSA